MPNAASDVAVASPTEPPLHPPSSVRPPHVTTTSTAVAAAAAAAAAATAASTTTATTATNADTRRPSRPSANHAGSGSAPAAPGSAAASAAHGAAGGAGGDGVGTTDAPGGATGTTATGGANGAAANGAGAGATATGGATASSPRDGGNGALAGSTTMDEYREGCLKLEKARHARVFEAEKRRLVLEQAVVTTYALEVRAILDEFVTLRRAAIQKALQDNADETRRVEELRYGIAKGDLAAGLWQQRRHDMALRVRPGEDRGRGGGGGGAAGDEDAAVEPVAVDKPKRSRKNEGRAQKVKVHIELDEAEVMADLAEIRGEKRAREPEPGGSSAPERRTKKRK